MNKKEILDFVFNGLRNMVEKRLEPGQEFNSKDIVEMVNEITEYTIRVEKPIYTIKFEHEGNVVIQWNYSNEDDLGMDYLLAITNAQEINNYKKYIYINRVYSQDNEGNIISEDELKSFVPVNF